MDLVYESFDVVPQNESKRGSKQEKLEEHFRTIDNLDEENLQQLSRIIEKDGSLNVIKKPAGWIWFNLFDFTTLLDMSWVSFIFIFGIIYGVSFFAFGGLFYFLNFIHSNNDTDNLDETKCYAGVSGIATGFLFALETSITIGYGTRLPHPVCPDGIILLLINVFWATFLSTLFAGIFLSRFARKGQSEDLKFSSEALITMRNRCLYLTFRVADPLYSQLDYGATATGLCVRYKVKDKEDSNSADTQFNFLHTQHINLGFQMDGTDSEIPLMWPTVVSHKIDKDSPLYRVGPKQLEEEKIEFIISMNGIRSETGGLIETTTSYINTEIVWGARFCHESVLRRVGRDNVVSFSQEDLDKYVRDTNTPRISAEQLDNLKEEAAMW